MSWFQMTICYMIPLQNVTKFSWAYVSFLELSDQMTPKNYNIDDVIEIREFLKVLLLVSNLNSIKRAPVRNMFQFWNILEIQEFGFGEIYHLDPNISNFCVENSFTNKL